MSWYIHAISLFKRPEQEDHVFQDGMSQNKQVNTQQDHIHALYELHMSWYFKESDQTHFIKP